MTEKAVDSKNTHTEKAVEDSLKTHVFIKSPVILLGDLLLRSSLFALINNGLVKDWLFWLGQLVIIPIVILIVTTITGIHGTYEKRIRKKFNLDKSDNIRFEATGWFVLLAIGIIIITSIMVYMLYPQWHIALRITVLVAFLALYTFYIITISLSSDGSEPKDKKLYQNTVTKTFTKDNTGLNEFIVELSTIDFQDTDIRSYLLQDEKNFPFIQNLIDNNDIEIVEMQSEVDSSTQRVDTYTLESALLGGLAFSGFLSLLSSDKPVITITRDLISDLSQLLENSPGTWWTGFNKILDENSLLAFVLIETLVCSMLFLSVIVARIRFNDTIKTTDFTVRSAKAYNEKEEEVFLSLMESGTYNKTYLGERLLFLNKETKGIINAALPLFDQIYSIINYMRVFRSLGLACFVLILATAALLVSKGLSIFFIALYILSYAYMSIDKLARTSNINKQSSLFKSTFKQK